jgi:hypothetical protein
LFEDPAFKVIPDTQLYVVGIQWNNCWTYCPRIHIHNQVYAEKYAADQDTFFKDYADSHAKLSNLGAKFNPPQVSVSVSLAIFLWGHPFHLQFLWVVC